MRRAKKLKQTSKLQTATHTLDNRHMDSVAKAREIQGRSQPNPTLFLCQLRSRESVEALQHTIQLKTLFFLPFTLTLSFSFFVSLSLAFPFAGKVTVMSQFLPFRRCCAANGSLFDGAEGETKRKRSVKVPERVGVNREATKKED